MRLRYQKEKYLRYSAAIARHSIKRRHISKGRKRGERKVVNNMSFLERHEWHTKKRYNNIVIAPPDLALLQSPDSVAGFIQQVTDVLEKKRSLYVDMKKVTSIDYPTIAALLAVLYKSKSLGIKINGNMPRNLSAKEMLVKSGFLYTLFSKSSEAGHKYEITADNQLFTLNERSLDVVDEIQKLVAVCVTGKEKKIPALFTTLGELMDNTASHANPVDESSEIPERWWISINYNHVEKKVEFVFVDYGVGILKSLLLKTGQHPAKTALQRAQKAFGSEATHKHLESIVTKSARKTYSLKRGRGEGIYGIYQAMRRGEIGNLYVVTNDAFGNISNNKYLKLNKSALGGTLYYWDICSNNLANNKV